MQCPGNEEERLQMYREMYNANPILYDKLMQMPDQTFNWLLGKQPDDVETSAMAQIWLIAGVHICSMYHQQIATRVGVG